MKVIASAYGDHTIKVWKDPCVIKSIQTCMSLVKSMSRTISMQVFTIAAITAAENHTSILDSL